MKIKISAEQYNKLQPWQQAKCTADGDGYQMELDGTDHKAKLDEFRQNNIQFKQQIEALQGDLSKFKDIDPTKYNETIKKLQEMEDKHLIDENKLEELLEVRTERMRQESAGQVDALTTDRDKYKTQADAANGRLSKLVIDSSITSAVSEVGAVRQGALTDILARAHGVYQLDVDGNAVPMRDGKIIFGKEGKSQMTPKEFCEGLLETAPYLFENSGGGGAGGDGGKGGRDGSKTIAQGDQGAFSSNLEDIAAGKVTVS